MMSAPLTQNQIDTLQTAHGHLQQGALDRCEHTVHQVLVLSANQPDALHLLGLVQKAKGRLSEARTTLEKAAHSAKRNPHIHNSLGNVLGDMGEHALALKSLHRAVELDPHYVEGWTNLGIVATDAGNLTLAKKALATATRLNPNHATAWDAYGNALKANGEIESALKAYQQGIAVKPDSTSLHHNLGVALRIDEQPIAALAAYDKAIALGLTGPEIGSHRAHALVDLGRHTEAIELYRYVVDAHPAHLDAHLSLSAQLWEQGLSDDPVSSYAPALKRVPMAKQLWLQALNTLIRGAHYEAAATLAAEALATLGDDTQLCYAHGEALNGLGEREKALPLLTRALALASGDMSAQASIHLGLARYHMKAASDPELAADHAGRALALAPDNQAAWANLGTAWRLLGDARADWLYDPEALVMIESLPNINMAELAATLTTLHDTQRNPADQSLRGGTQTRGNLFTKKQPVLHRAVADIRAAIARAVATVAADAKHPFRRHFCGRTAWDFTGSWSVRLASDGFHVSHIHPAGRMSSALYVALPTVIAAADKNHAGWIQFGAPPVELGLNLKPYRLVQPQPGRLVLFPSYMWHGTVPFEADTPRLTVAFDVA